MAPSATEVLSAIIGWTYMLFWTASFYPQFLLNLRRKSTHGFSVEFALLNVLGMGSYAAYNLALYSSPVVRGQYARHHPASPDPAVQLNDVAYALHGTAITALTYSQFYPQLWRFPSREGITRPSGWALGLFWGCIGLAGLAVLLVVASPPSMAWEWLDVIYLLGNFKALLTFVKYAPQVLLNYQRKSTRGLSIFQFTLDIVGAILSLLQLAIDSTSHGDWSSVLNNPAKFALGNVTLFFDLLFYVQHFLLYPGSWRGDESEDKVDFVDETEPLLGAPGHSV